MSLKRNLKGSVRKQSKTVTVTIGIPTYNEEKNIGKLLNFLTTKLKTDDRVRIIQLIISDDSTDRTPDIVKKFQERYPFIELYHHEKRLGQTLSINEIFKRAKGDVLVILEADIMINDETLILKLVEPFIRDPNVGLVGGRPILIEEKGVIAAICASRYYIWDYVRCNFKDKQKGNPWIANSRILALSRKLYKDIELPPLPGADELIWCMNKLKGYKEIFRSDAIVYFKEAGNLRDMIFRWSREFSIRRRTMDYFRRMGFYNLIGLPEDFVPKHILIKGVIYSLRKKFFGTILGVILYFMLKLISKRVWPSPHWKPAKSTKKLPW